MTTNSVGVHALVWAGGWSAKEAEHAIRSSKEAGYDLIEIQVFNTDEIDTRGTRELLREYDLKAATSFGLTPEQDVSSEDPETVARGRQKLAECLRVAEQLGAFCLSGITYGALAKHAAPVSDAGRANSIAAVRDLCQDAAGRGVVIGLEVANRYETNLLNTALQARAYAEEVDHENLMIHLDSYHMNIEEADLYSAVLSAGDRLGYVHVGENHRGYLGSGHVDFLSLFRALHAIDYSGPVTFESFSSRVVMQELSWTLAIWRDMWNDGVALASQARAFIGAHLAGAASVDSARG